MLNLGNKNKKIQDDKNYFKKNIKIIHFTGV